jgi:hypothetical protein
MRNYVLMLLLLCSTSAYADVMQCRTGSKVVGHFIASTGLFETKDGQLIDRQTPEVRDNCSFIDNEDYPLYEDHASGWENTNYNKRIW